MTKPVISGITKQAEQLVLSFSKSWSQEDIGLLTELVFSGLASVNMQEKIIGADRENIRFSWQEQYFILNFDCCSQSCWLEGQDEAGTQHLEQLYLSLAK